MVGGLGFTDGESVMSDRAEFEREAEMVGYNVRKAGAGLYFYDDTEMAWELWQAARAQAVPNEHGKNRYGLDMAYFRNLFNRELNRPLVDFRPDELARVLARAARTADAAVLQEPEFQAARAQGGHGVEPVALLRREIGETSWFDHNPVKPDTPEAGWIKNSNIWDYCEVYTHPQPAQQGSVPDVGAMADVLGEELRRTQAVYLTQVTLMGMIRKMITATPQPEGDGWKLPYDVVINGGMTFRKGVKLSTFVKAAERWHRGAMKQYAGISKSDIEALMSATSQPQGDGWLYREPDHGEEDYCGQVWTLDCNGQVELLSKDDCIAEFMSSDAAIIAFQPTGLKRPQPPVKQEGKGNE